MGRIRAACDLLAQYISGTARAALFASYEYVSLYALFLCLKTFGSFTELEEYLKRVEAETIVTTGSAKHEKDKKVSATGTSKKRKATKGSQGVEKLKKVNVNGMAKLSSFFSKS